ncbi:MAG: glycosyltransferase [Candidatus Helarchaeota archaeon]
MTKKRILFINAVASSFVKTDIEILSKHFIIINYKYQPYKKLFPFLKETIRLIIFLLKNIKSATYIYSWFADYHSAISFIIGKIFRKKNIVVIGGYDAASIPELNYGIFSKNNFRAKCAKFTYKNAHLILPVDSTLIQSINFYTYPYGKKEGFSNFVKNIKAEIKTLPTGYDFLKWKYNFTKKNKDVITVASCNNIKTFKLKGLDFFIDIAKLMPEKSFTIVGIEGVFFETIKKILPKNVTIIPFVTQEKLIDIFSAHKIYAQFSLSEGLPNTLCEAMLCQCIPIGSNVNGIPNAIGDTGFILNKKDINDAKILIEKALISPYDLDIMARKRIIDLFSLNNRKNNLIKYINQI